MGVRVGLVKRIDALKPKGRMVDSARMQRNGNVEESSYTISVHVGAAYT